MGLTVSACFLNFDYLSSVETEWLMIPWGFFGNFTKHALRPRRADVGKLNIETISSLGGGVRLVLFI